VEHVLAYGDELAPSNRTVTLLFLDIRSFTTFSENLPPRAVLEFLDEFLGEMSRIVMGHDGTVNKFLGDGLMAFWGAPTRQEDHAVRAVRAALDIRRRLAELNRDRVEKGLKPVAVGLGLHTGSVAAGMLGGAEQHEYTVIGDTVNVASRLESLTKALGTDVLLSEDTVSCLGARFDCERLAEEHVKGRTAPVVVYGLRGPAPSPP
jgi:adenylate cyclase